MKMRTAVAISIVALACSRAAWANDAWEINGSEDGAVTTAHILPGQVQVGRDLEPAGIAADQDWLALATMARHSYEARATGGPVWASASSIGAQLDRVSVGGVVLTPGTSAGVALLRGQTVRWVAGPAPGTEFLRVAAALHEGSLDPYTLELFDTSYAVPRWNNTATQTTILLIQNNTDTAISGDIYFYNAAGTLLHTQPLAIPADGIQVLNTSTLAPLIGQSGSARIAHLGGVGALSGKAVALEPGTGFTFDTAIVPMAR